MVGRDRRARRKGNFPTQFAFDPIRVRKTSPRWRGRHRRRARRSRPPLLLVIRVYGRQDGGVVMNEAHHENPHAPLSYYGARRIVWLVFFIFIVWLMLRALQPVILLFALVFLLAMVLNPLVVSLQKHRVPSFVGVILVMLALISVTTTIILFAIPPL